MCTVTMTALMCRKRQTISTNCIGSLPLTVLINQQNALVNKKTMHTTLYM